MSSIGLFRFLKKMCHNNFFSYRIIEVFHIKKKKKNRRRTQVFFYTFNNFQEDFISISIYLSDVSQQYIQNIKLEISCVIR